MVVQEPVRREKGLAAARRHHDEPRLLLLVQEVGGHPVVGRELVVAERYRARLRTELQGDIGIPGAGHVLRPLNPCLYMRRACARLRVSDVFSKGRRPRTTTSLL